MNYVSAFAIAVVPAVLRYYRDFCTPCDRQGVANYFPAAAAIGGIIKRNASISGAEMGCQGEVGSAAAMAAAGLAAALGGSNEQIESAAEIALEHHLGNDLRSHWRPGAHPVHRTQCFWRHQGDQCRINGPARRWHAPLSLDQAIETLRQTGTDMQSKYRETSRGGLAVNVPEC
jgi:L-serine dehydratase